MSTETTAKLTKKQQKALAHKQGVRGKGKGKAREQELRDNQLEIPEQDLDADEKAEAVSPVKKVSKKRKRDQEDGNEDGEAEGEDAADGTGEAKTGKTRNQQKRAAAKNRKQRFIVFVGNLPYKVTTEDIVAHFAEACGESPSVRLLTPKTDAPVDTTKAEKSKGCAFVEFTTSSALQSALHLHQSLFTSSHTSTKRKINVELTAGGGGNSAGRLTKLKDTKERLEKQREKHRTVEDEEREKRDIEKKRVREEWKEKMSSEKEKMKNKPFKERKAKTPRWLSGTNAVKLG